MAHPMTACDRLSSRISQERATASAAGLPSWARARAATASRVPTPPTVTGTSAAAVVSPTNPATSSGPSHAEQPQHGQPREVEQSVEYRAAEGAPQWVAHALQVPGLEHVPGLAGRESARRQPYRVDAPGAGPAHWHAHVI